jgi:hypothetical protein
MVQQKYCIVIDRLLTWINIRNTQKYNSIVNSIFHEKLPDDDPAGSKHVANVHNKTNINTVILVYLL